ncbi:MAG TPA: cell division protein FtsA [Ktedonobacterales bacterium]
MATLAPQLFAGLDIGGAAITAVAVVREPDGRIAYVQSARVESAGVRDGVVVDLATATEAVARALYELEDRLDRRLPPLCLGVGGRHVQSVNLRGETDIAPVGREIVPDDIARVIGAARAGLRLGENRELLHEIPRAYMVDGQVGVRDPRGMAAHDLEVEVHYVSAAATSLRNLLKCVRGARGMPEMVVSAPLAAAEALREALPSAQCLAIADIGAETTNLTIQVAGTVWHSEVIGEGGAAITRELAAQLKLPYPAAEALKLAHGTCDLARHDEFALVELSDMGGDLAGDDAADVVPAAELARVIQQRAYRCADLLAERLEDARRLGVEPEALVLAGGAAALDGIEALLGRALEVPVYRGRLAGIAGLPPVLESPAYATAAGLALWHARYGTAGERPARHRGVLPGLMTGMRRLLGAASA